MVNQASLVAQEVQHLRSLAMPPLEQNGTSLGSQGERQRFWRHRRGMIGMFAQEEMGLGQIGGHQGDTGEEIPAPQRQPFRVQKDSATRSGDHGIGNDRNFWITLQEINDCLNRVSGGQHAQLDAIDPDIIQCRLHLPGDKGSGEGMDHGDVGGILHRDGGDGRLGDPPQMFDHANIQRQPGTTGGIGTGDRQYPAFDVLIDHSCQAFPAVSD